MLSENDLKLGAKKLVETCIGLAKGEELVIFCDAARIDLANACTRAALKVEAHPSVFFIPEAARPIQRLSEVMKTSMEEADAVLIMLSHLHTETKFRGQVVEYTRRRPIRVANMPGVERVHLEKWINLPYDDLAINTERVASALLKARKAEVITDAGTHIEIPLAGWDSGAVEAETGLLTEPGLWGNLPAGEAFAVPALRKANGTIVVDGSIPNLLIKQPLTIKVEKGRATDMQPEECEECRTLSRSFKEGGSNSRVLVEFGIGTNNQIGTVQGSTIADEKIKGTVHFGFGSSAGFGGSVEASNHDDLVVLNPTVLLDAIPLIKEGQFSKDFVFEEDTEETAPLGIPTARKIARNEGVRCMEMGERLYRYWKGCLGFKHMTKIGNENTSKTARRIWYNIGGFKPYSKTVHELARILRVNDEMVLRTLAVMDKYGLISC